MQEAVLQLVRTVESGKFEGVVQQYFSYALAAIRHRAMDVSRRRKTRLKYELLNNDLQAEHDNNPWLCCEHDNDVYRRHVECILRRMPAEQAELLLP